MAYAQVQLVKKANGNKRNGNGAPNPTLGSVEDLEEHASCGPVGSLLYVLLVPDDSFDSSMLVSTTIASPSLVDDDGE